MKPTLVSVICPVYNGQAHIECTIKSVLNQTYPFIEFILVDGNSTDDTITIINKYKQQNKVIKI